MSTNYATWNPAQKVAHAAHQMTTHAHDPRRNPPRPRPRTENEHNAVTRLEQHRCLAAPDRGHLIPSTSTVCLRCGIDANTLEPNA